VLQPVVTPVLSPINQCIHSFRLYIYSQSTTSAHSLLWNTDVSRSRTRGELPKCFTSSDKSSSSHKVDAFTFTRRLLIHARLRIAATHKGHWDLRRHQRCSWDYNISFVRARVYVCVCVSFRNSDDAFHARISDRCVSSCRPIGRPSMIHNNVLNHCSLRFSTHIPLAKSTVHVWPRRKLLTTSAEEVMFSSAFVCLFVC